MNSLFQKAKIYPILDLDFCEKQNQSIFSILELWNQYPNQILFFQFRAKSISSEEYRRIYLELKKKASMPILINDEFEIAVSESAFGLHLGKEDFLALDPKQKNEIQNSKILLKGTSSHSIQDIKDLDVSIWDYTGLGPIFETYSKKSNYPSLGISILGEALKICKIPIVPIGGINLENFESVQACGNLIPASISAVNDKKIFFNLLDFID
jgi:thiamine-phosphate pyrophosphorylase